MKKILILEGSPRVHGNSNILSEQFAKGAKEGGYVLGVGTNEPGDVKETKAMEEAYEMGKAIS